VIAALGTIDPRVAAATEHLVRLVFSFRSSTIQAVADAPGDPMKRLSLLCVVICLFVERRASEAPKPAAPPAAATPSRVVTEHFHSDALGVDKDVVVYLPRGYDAQPARKWPVFYYLHGLGGNETSWVKQGKLDAAADGLALEAIVVMPDGDDGFTSIRRARSTTTSA